MNHALTIRARLTAAMFRAAAIPLAALTLSTTAFAQSPPPIELLAIALPGGAQTNAECLARIRAGFDKAGYVNITVVPNDGGFKGMIVKGDNAGVSTHASCFSAGLFVLMISSAGTSSLGDVAPFTQNSRLLGAIVNP